MLVPFFSLRCWRGEDDWVCLEGSGPAAGTCLWRREDMVFYSVFVEVQGVMKGCGGLVGRFLRVECSL
jgi:hypothetical protein